MSQVVFNAIDPSTTSGNQLADILNNFKDALMSGLIGSSRPPELDAGGMWVDNSQELSNNLWEVKIYTGITDIVVFKLNLTTGTTSIGNSENTFEVVRTSADSVGPLLKLLKKRVANNGQTLVGDVLGELQFLGATNSLTTPVSARIRAIATDDFTTTEQGSTLVFEVINTDSNTLTEFMRVFNNRLGIGTANPQEKLHVSGNAKIERVLDDNNPAKLIFKKSRVTGAGQTQTSDAISEISSIAKDESGNEVETFSIVNTASENISTTAQGTITEFKNKKLGTTVFQTLISLGDYLSLGKISNSKLTVNAGKTKALATSSAAGISVETSDDGDFAVTFDDTLTSKFKVGKVGTQKEILDVDSAQISQNKSIRTPSRADVKQDTEANLTTYALTTTNGQWCFATDTKVMYQVIDTELVPSGSGGGGSSLIWEKTTSIAPSSLQVDGFQLEEFDYVDSQEMYATFIVPTSYRVGKPIKLVGASLFCGVNTGKILMKTDCTLIRSGSTVLGTYPNTRVSTNAEITVAGTVNQLSDVGDFDLTDATGQINGVAVAPKDKLRIRLYRNVGSESASAQATAKLMVNAMEVKLS